MPFHQNTFEAQRRMMGEVEHLRVHMQMDRMKVSKTAHDLIEYCQRNIQADPLIYTVKENPFKEKKTCTIL